MLVATLCSFCLTSAATAAEVIPPKPDRYFNDYAGVVPAQAAQNFNEQLAQFERETSNQVVVAVFPKMQSDSSIEDYAQRVAQSWAVGQKDRRNGVALLVFVNDRKMSIQVGYGLEGILPDATAYDIRANRMTPHFRQQNYEAGLAVGINSILQAIRGEYKGTGRTVRENESQGQARALDKVVFFVFLFIILILFIRFSRRSRKRGYGYSHMGGPFIGGWSGGSGGGGGWSSGGGGGFSGFSGGGGSFGGGGSSGSW